MSSPLVNDGSIPFGSAIFTINSVAYIADSIKLDRPTNSLKRKDETGAPSGRVVLADFSEGSATLQLASTSTALPPNGTVFISNFADGTNANYIVTKVSLAIGAEEIKKADIEFALKIN